MYSYLFFQLRVPDSSVASHNVRITALVCMYMYDYCRGHCMYAHVCNDFLLFRYYRPCFNGAGFVSMADGSTKAVRNVQVGDFVRTEVQTNQCHNRTKQLVSLHPLLLQHGSRAVVKVYVTPVNRVRRMVSISGVLYTRRHPICVNGQWLRAVDVVSINAQGYLPSVYWCFWSRSHIKFNFYTTRRQRSWCGWTRCIISCWRGSILTTITLCLLMVTTTT